MEFSYSLSEREYLQASRMALRSKRNGVVKTVLFWAFIVICLVLLFTVIQKNSQSGPDPQSEGETVSTATPAPTGWALAVQLAPGVLGLAAGALAVFLWIPYTRRRLYRKDKNLHGVITVTVDRQSFASRSTTGASLQCPWSVFQRWLESGGIVLLGYPNGTFAILNVAGLSDAERQELRGILAEVLPQKK